MPLALTDHAGNSTAGIHLHGLAHALRCLGRLSGRPSASCDGGALVGCRPTLQNRSRAWATVCHGPEESAQDGTSLLHSTTTTERLCCRLGAIECAAEPTVMWHARLTCRGLARRCALGEGVWCTRTKRYLESNPYSCSTYYVRTLHFATCEPKKPRQAHEHALHQSHAGHGCRCQTVRPRH